MTVSQQIKDYYTRLLPNGMAHVDLAKRLGERLVTPDGIKVHPSPEDFFAERGQRQTDIDADRGHFLSEQV